MVAEMVAELCVKSHPEFPTLLTLPQRKSASCVDASGNIEKSEYFLKQNTNQNHYTFSIASTTRHLHLRTRTDVSNNVECVSDTTGLNNFENIILFSSDFVL
eukprot:958584_1